MDSHGPPVVRGPLFEKHWSGAMISLEFTHVSHIETLALVVSSSDYCEHLSLLEFLL
jgi:hypothetical protein